MPKRARESESDISSIEFPTDRITLGDMRRTEPGIMLNERALLDRHPVNIDAIAAAQIEHILALKAWAAASGRSDPKPLRSRRGSIEFLAQVYKDYGLATGRRQTEELVRRFEVEATRLAGHSMGQGHG